MSSSNSPCAACKFLRRKCTQECVFAPYFPPENPQKFQDVHKVFGASNVTKILNEIPASQREDAVNSLAYEAKARINDPVYGCVGYISILRHKLEQLQNDLNNAKKELSNYIGPTAMLPMITSQGGYLPLQHPGNPSSSMIAYNVHPMMGIPGGASGQLVIREPQQQYLQHQQQQIFEAQQLAAAVAVREQQQDMKWGYEPSPQQHELVSFNSGHDASTVSVTATGFNQMSHGGSAVSPSLALGGSFDNLNIQAHQQQLEHAHHHHHQLQAQLLLQPEQPQEPNQPEEIKHLPQQQKSASQEGRSIGPSC